MIGWKQYALSIIICSLFCGIITSLISDSRGKRMFHLIGGVVLAVAVLRPLAGARIDGILNAEPFLRYSADPYLSIGETAAREVQAQYIKEACEAYISSKAEAFGTPLTVEVLLNEALLPVYAELHANANASVQERLSGILEKELEITKENQLWIWNQESSSS